jgi:hypothetical protein
MAPLGIKPQDAFSEEAGHNGAIIPEKNEQCLLRWRLLLP